MTPYAITGVGLVSPLGVGYEVFRRALAAWALEPRDLFEGHASVLDPIQVPQPVAAECLSFDPKQLLGDKGLRNFDRLTKLLIACGKLALEDAGLKRDGVHRISPDRIGVCSATAYGSLEAITEAVQVTELEDPRFLNPNRFPNTVSNAAAGYVSIWEDLRAPNVTVVDGNCGSLDAVMSGETHLQNDRADAFLVGGGEALSEILYAAFRKLDVLAEGERKFAPGRHDSQGMRLGEGAAYLCLEQAAFAAARGARVYGEIVGYGNAFEPPDSEALIVHVSSVAITRAIRMALDDAEVEPARIDVIASAQSGIAAFDLAELEGIRALLPHTPIAAPKGIFGETCGAGGALAMACGLAWMAGVPVAPVVHGTVAGPVQYVLVVAVGYYGNASAVVLRAAS
ncbi:MAG: beta-ketoacyl synthase N-terminal-like domain-containing protein [Polyangiales bacterium]